MLLGRGFHRPCCFFVHPFFPPYLPLLPLLNHNGCALSLAWPFLFALLCQHARVRVRAETRHPFFSSPFLFLLLVRSHPLLHAPTVALCLVKLRPRSETENPKEPNAKVARLAVDRWTVVCPLLRPLHVSHGPTVTLFRAAGAGAEDEPPRCSLYFAAKQPRKVLSN